MSVQIFLQGQLLGIENYLCDPGGSPAAHAWRVHAITEDLPLAFLQSQGLSPILLRSGGAGQVLLVLPQETREAAEAFFTRASDDIAAESKGLLRLIVASTENLGSWRLIRERLDEVLASHHGHSGPVPSFEPFLPTPVEASASDGVQPVLRGDVDNFEFLLRGAESIEAYVTLSVLFKNFFAGEIRRLCEGKAAVIDTGGNDFSVQGPWQELIAIAAEIYRLFDRFIDENLKDYSGPEGKTLSMAIALSEPGDAEAGVFCRCGQMLGQAKAVTRGGFQLFGRIIEAKQNAEAESIKDLAVKLIREFKCSTAFLDELRGFYPESPGVGRRRVAKFDRPWRFYRRLAASLDPDRRRARSREFEATRTALAGEIIGKNVGQARLRPTGRVALEWARMLIEE